MTVVLFTHYWQQDTSLVKKQAPHTFLSSIDTDTYLTSHLSTNVWSTPASSKWFIPYYKIKKKHIYIFHFQNNFFSLGVFNLGEKNNMVFSISVHTKTPNDNRLGKWHPITPTLLFTGLSAGTKRSHQGWQNIADSCDEARTRQSNSLHRLGPQISMTSYLERVPPVLLDSAVLGWLVAMVTLPRHSGGPPECAWLVEKGGVSPLVLFTGLTGHGQEAAHRELRLRICGVMREGRRQVSVLGCSTYPAQLMLRLQQYTLWKYRVLVFLLNIPPPRC